MSSICPICLLLQLKWLPDQNCMLESRKRTVFWAIFTGAGASDVTPAQFHTWSSNAFGHLLLHSMLGKCVDLSQLSVSLERVAVQIEVEGSLPL